MELTGSLRDAPMPPGSVMRSAGVLCGRPYAIMTLPPSVSRSAVTYPLANFLRPWPCQPGPAHLGSRSRFARRISDCLPRGGDDHNARIFCQQAVAIDPGHAEARTTALALDVASADRGLPVRRVVVDRRARSGPDETVVVRLDEDSVPLEAPLDGLPFAPSSLRHIQVSLELLLTYDEERQDAVVAHLLSLLTPDGRLEVVRTGPERLLARWPGSVAVVERESASI